jgi:hypothetical protein
LGKDVFTGQKHAFQVNIHYFVPPFLAGTQDITDTRDTDIVMEDINPAKDLNTFGRHALTVNGSGHVSLKHGTFSALLVNDTPSLLSRRQITINQHDPRSFPGIKNGSSLPVSHTRSAGTGACNDGRFTFDTFSHISTSYYFMSTNLTPG